jgi:acyl-CoA thioesterase-1
MRKYYIIAAIAILAILTWLIFYHKQPSYTPPTTGNENIVIFGDSLAYGIGSNPGHDLASLLNQKTGLPTINAGVSGDTAISAEPRLESEVLSKNPKVVIILLGGNDFLHQIPPQQTMTSIRNIVEAIQKTGAGVILINEEKIFATTPLFKNLAKEKQIPYIENILGGIINHKELMYDEIHPNDSGYEIMAEKIRPVLESYLK